MTKRIALIFTISTFTIILFTSCLKSNLPNYPSFKGNSITNVYLEYRYNSDKMHWGEPVVAYKKLIVDETINSKNHTISLSVTVPPASGSFTDSVRALVSLKKLWPYFDVSTAATMTSVGNTPEPGFSTDFTKPQTYMVTAANGDQQKWTVKVTSFKK